MEIFDGFMTRRVFAKSASNFSRRLIFTNAARRSEPQKTSSALDAS